MQIILHIIKSTRRVAITRAAEEGRLDVLRRIQEAGPVMPRHHRRLAVHPSDS